MRQHIILWIKIMLYMKHRQVYELVILFNVINKFYKDNDIDL